MKITALLCSILLLWNAPAQAVRLIDVPNQEPKARSVQKAIEHYRVLEAYPDQTFRGKTPFTRYQLAQSSFQALQYLKQIGKLKIETPLTSYGYYRLLLQENGGDVPARHWAVNAIQELFAHGLISAQDNRFRGAAKVTRYELAAQVFGFLKWLQLDSHNTNLNSRPLIARDLPRDHWAYEAVTTLLDKGILNLDSNGYFHGDHPANHYDLASSLVEALQWIEKAELQAPLQPKDPVLPQTITIKPQPTTSQLRPDGKRSRSPKQRL